MQHSSLQYMCTCCHTKCVIGVDSMCSQLYTRLHLASPFRYKTWASVPVDSCRFADSMRSRVLCSSRFGLTCAAFLSVFYWLTSLASIAYFYIFIGIYTTTTESYQAHCRQSVKQQASATFFETRYFAVYQHIFRPGQNTSLCFKFAHWVCLHIENLALHWSIQPGFQMEFSYCYVCVWTYKMGCLRIYTVCVSQNTMCVHA